MSSSTALADLILHTYPWWEMQRVRQISLLHPKNPVRLCSNQWQHAPGLLDHTHRGVTTPNCDTMYSTAWLDLSAGPVLIEVPTSPLPYWSVAVMDINTDNIAIMGNRYADTQSLLVCHDSHATGFSNDQPHVRSRSKVLWLLGRFLIGNDALESQAETMRRGMRLSKPDHTRAALAPPAALPRAIRKDPANFWQVICESLKEDAALRTLLPVGSDADLAWPPAFASWDHLNPVFQQGFANAYADVLKALSRSTSPNRQWRGCWRYPGVGMGQFGDNALYRAETALWGLGALELKEVVYASAFKDNTNEALNGTNAYRFRIPESGMHSGAFWSLTMYEIDPKGGLYFTENPLKRYAIGDRSEGLQRNADGSTDLVISNHAPPASTPLANWLPAPAADFGLVIRAYAPSAALQAGQADFPDIVRLND